MGTSGTDGVTRDYPTRAETREVLLGLADETLSRDEASDWAWGYLAQDSRCYDECIQDALDRLAGAEPLPPGITGDYAVDDFRDWLQDFDRCVTDRTVEDTVTRSAPGTDPAGLD
ncbi:hypothetical protein ACFWH7_06935 [Cellulosimicrobium cellulans]|uniref:hypothetical protein n=1 Tax=Cellulosimicrobium cellulans TaxID=1710 RepID=UPI00365B4716